MQPTFGAYPYTVNGAYPYTVNAAYPYPGNAAYLPPAPGIVTYYKSSNAANQQSSNAACHQSEYSATTYRPPGFTVKSDSAANASNTYPPERGIVSRKHPRLNPSSPFPSEEDTIETSISDRDRRDLSESKDYFSDEAEDESPPTKKRIAPHKHTVKILNSVTEKPLKDEKSKGKFPSPIIILQRWMMQWHA